ncbi:MAG: DUF1963 domain-containing protein [Chloroflexales bacterium]|nr:DUF1963 domain-containing protein [Chloroflexales bacterium]
MLAILLNAIERYGLPHWKDAFLGLEKPSLRIATHLVAEEPTLGSSKIGGLPDLPLQISWPKNTQRSLSFIAQLNMRDIHHQMPTIAMPETGMLYFFYETVDLPYEHESNGVKNWQVLYHTNTDTIRRSPVSADLINDPDYFSLLDPAIVTSAPERASPG